MKKKALRKDFFMEIRKTYNRFFSIFLIVALGVAFFSGIRATKPDMELSADKFFDESNLMDIRVIGTYGLTVEDLAAIKNIKGVLEARGGYTYDVLVYHGENQGVLQLQSFSDEINKITLSEGRYPEESGECIIDEKLVESMGYQIGESIQVFSGNEDLTEDYIGRDIFTIVGIGTTPYYLSFEREASQIGNGTVSGFVMIPEEDFVMEVFTNIDMLVEGSRELVSYREDYVDLIKEVVDNIEAIKEERCTIRYELIMEEANEEIRKAEKELSDAEKEAQEELDDAYNKITEAKEKIADGKQELEDGEKELEEGREKLADAKTELAKGKKEYQDGKKKIEDAKKEYEKGKTEIEKQWKELEAGQNEIEENEKALAAARAEIDEKKAALEAGREYLSEAEYNKMAEEIAVYEAPIIQGEQELLIAKEAISQGKIQLEEGEKKLTAAEQEIKKGEKDLAAAWKKILDGEREIKEGEEEIEKNEIKIADAKKELEDGEKELEENEEKYWDGKKEAEEKIADAKVELEDAKEAIKDLKKPEWYVLDREHMQVLAEYGQNAQRIGAIGEVFPVIFFLVAALVCLTTMTRMVEDQRTQIGTLKALGYGKGEVTAKFLLYAGIASVTGGIFGVLIGQWTLPMVILGAYGIMYANLPYQLTPFHFYYGITSILAVSACTMIAAYSACMKEMHETAAQLMRPEAPKKGKRVLLERIPFIWNHMKFTQKASIRNLFRYKKRLFMTIIGIAGCMALVLVGYGVRDSIYNIAVIQYEKLFVYSGSITLKEGIGESSRNKLYEYLEKNKDIEGYLKVYENTVTVVSEEVEKTVYLVIPEVKEGFNNYITLQNRTNGEVYSIDTAEEGVIITEKLASLLGVTAGDTIELKIDETKREKAVVSAITENYAMHYVYMTGEAYEKAFGEKAESNALFYRGKDWEPSLERKFGEEVLSYKAASGIRFNSETRENIEEMLGALDVVVWVLILSAGLLAFVVLYNLNNINITERKRELATLKVLGFYDEEVAAYVYRENIILTLIGIAGGIFLGVILHRYVILTAEVDALMFGRNIEIKSYIYSGLLTMLFSILINGIMYFKLKKIDMIESLKSIE